jgi:membrane-bound lytic murein transglycosylase D
MRIMVGILALMFLTSACTHFDQVPGGRSPGAVPKELASYHVNDPEPPEITDKELEVIPEEINERVEKWLDYFQGKGRGHMERYLARSTRYIKLMKTILRQNGLPEDLVYIALIESGFSSRATSRAAAVGYWQFIRATGKRYGLEVNSFVDERRDPVLSTQAAAEYFKGLYSVFGSWYLSMASYNVGENRVKREVMRHFTRDFWELARKRRFPRETINYVPKFIAAKIIGKNPEKFGFTNIEYEKPIEFELIKVQQPVSLRMMASKMGMEYEALKLLNPKFRGEIAPTKSNGLLELRVPTGQTQVAMTAATQSFVNKVELIADVGETETYKVRPGDSLYLIARKYHTTVAWLRDSNDIKAGKKLRIGMRLQVPERRGAVVAQKKVKRTIAQVKNSKEDAEKAAANPELVTARGTFYIVQPGDTLSAIADEYDSSISEIKRMNSLGKRSLIKVGMKLKVPKDDGLPTDVEASSGGDNARKAHIVRAGENLTTIAKQYGVTIQELKKANNLRKRSMIRMGTTLIIPGDKRKPASTKRVSRSRVHIVKRGENLSHIADRYDISIESLKHQNRLNKGSRLIVGAKLFIPLAEAAR